MNFGTRLTKRYQKTRRTLGRLLRGENLLIVSQPKEKWNRQFARSKWDNLADEPYNTAVIAQVIRERAREKRVRVLDFGCGDGVLAQYVLESGAPVSYLGIDISEVALEKARKRAPAGTFQLDPQESGPALTGAFDIIVFAEVLLYLDFKRVLARYRSYLAEDGVLIISLYSSWRTRVIWWLLRPLLMFEKDIRIKDKSRGISWRVCTARYR